jgi:NarL family two-component system response regulator LiaR
MTKRLILIGVVLALASIALRMMEYKFVILDHSLELYGGALAIVFTIVGIWAGNKLTKKKEIIVEKLVHVEGKLNMPFEKNVKMLEKMGISSREYEILELMAQGYSNQEIADKIFLSIHTVKTHSSNLFLKLDAKRRTQAISKAKEYGLIP